MQAVISTRKSISVSLVVLALLIISVGIAGAKGFTHAPMINVDGEYYYMGGAPDGPDGATDIPGHEWVQAGPNQVVGKHFNTGPFGMPQWWSSDATDGAYLFTVHGIIDTWSLEQAESYAARGYVHYHELLSVPDKIKHPTKVVWLKHTAVSSFYFDGGPHPEYGHEVTPGVDYEFIPMGFDPYTPETP